MLPLHQQETVAQTREVTCPGSPRGQAVWRNGAWAFASVIARSLGSPPTCNQTFLLRTHVLGGRFHSSEWPGRALGPCVTGEQTEALSTMTSPGPCGWEGGCLTRMRSPALTGSWAPATQGRCLCRAGTNLGVFPQGGSSFPLQGCGAWRPPGAPPPPSSMPQPVKGWDTVTCRTEISRSSCSLWVLGFKVV